MNPNNKDYDDGDFRYATILGLLILLAILLVVRTGYIFVSDPERFPIATIKVAATYEHLTHKALEAVLEQYVNDSFFSLSVDKLQSDLLKISWVDSAYVERVWPDTVKIRIIEKKPVAIWGNALLAGDGKLFNKGAVPVDLNMPRLKGPISQQAEVLQVYLKLSKILSSYGLNATGLELRENQAWSLTLNNGTKIYLGKNELEARLQRFCKAYPAVFAEKADQLASVDLRYPRGMAVQWKQQTGR